MSLSSVFKANVHLLFGIVNSYIYLGAYEPPKAAKEDPTVHNGITQST